MSALTTLFPVFFMLALGFISKWRGWISEEQKNGANTIIFKILFPALVLNLVSTADLKLEHAQVFLYVVVVYVAGLFIGKLLAKKLTGKYARFSPYLMTVVEGGNVGLPLYLSIVGTSSNTVLFDIAGTIVAFVIFPVLIARQTASGTSAKDILKSIFTNSFVIAVIIGLVLNFTGLYDWILASSFGELVTNVFSNLTAPIMPLILFILGYDLSVNKETLKPILKLMAVKTIWFALVICGFFILFPHLMADKTYMMAPLIYFMCPSGFGLMPVIEPLYADQDDASFASAFVSMYMIVTLIVYTLVVVFVA